MWFSFPISNCLNRNAELYTRKGMMLDKDCSCIFDAASDKSSTGYFELSYDQRDDGWSVNHFRFNKISTKEINFYNHYTKMEDLKAIEEIELFPPRFILDVEKQPNCTNNVNRKIRTALFKTENSTMTESVSFKLFVPISITKPWPVSCSCTLSIEDSLNSTIRQESNFTSIPSHDCDKNKPEPKHLMKYSTEIAHYWQHIALLLGIPKGRVSTIDLNNKRIEQKCFDLFDTWLGRTPHACWCDFIQALFNVGPSGVVEEAKAHLKSSEIDGHNEVNLYQLVQFLNDVPDCDLRYFIIKLLPKNTALKVIKDIRQGEKRSKEDITKKICQAFLKERDPSWAKVHKALIETKCIDLADAVEASFL